jgi:hypothetical protein
LKDIEKIGTNSHFYSETAGRCEVNFYDIRFAFKDMGITIEQLKAHLAKHGDISFPKGKLFAAFPSNCNFQLWHRTLFPNELL